MYAAAQAARVERRAQAARELQARRDRQDAQAAAAAAAEAEDEGASSRSDAAAPELEPAAAADAAGEAGGAATESDPTMDPAPQQRAATAGAATAANPVARPPAAAAGAARQVPPRVPTAAEMAAAAGEVDGAAAESDPAPQQRADTAGAATAADPASRPPAAAAAGTARQVFMRPSTGDIDEIVSNDDDSGDDADEADDDSDDDSDDADAGAGGSGRNLGLDAKLKLDSNFVSENTPLKRKRRRLDPTSESPWRFVKRVRDLERAMAQAGYPEDVIKGEVAKKRGRLTHVCIKCWLLMPMGNVKGRWVSSNVTSHFETRCTEESEKRSKVQQESLDRQDGKVDAMFGAPLRNPAFEVPLDQSALASQARMYIYSRMHVSKQHFDDGAWRETLQSAYEFGGGTGKMVFLTSQGLSSWVRAEYAVFEMYVKFFFELGWEFHEGNGFSQVGYGSCM